MGLVIVAAGTIGVIGSACGGSTRSDDTSASDGGIAGDGAAAIGSVDGAVPVPTVPPKGPAVVMFGGDGFSYLDDTWEWNAGWRKVTTQSSPPKRASHAMAALGKKIVLFGGEGPQPLGDTWEYDGASWTEKKIPGPSARSRHVMATLGDRVVMFGGLNLADTWEYDGTSWSQKMVTGPNQGDSMAMATLGNKVVLFGGLVSDSTWEYDGASWVEKKLKPNPASATAHDALYAPAMATIGNQIVFFGGEIDANNTFADTWTYDGTEWKKLAVSGPQGRWHHGMATIGAQLLMFGGDGVNPPTILGDTWTLDVNANWSQSQATTTPAARYVYTLATRP